MRKFSESLDNEIDVAYIRQCFADLIDSGAATVEARESASYGKWAAISISQFETDRIISPAKEFISRNNSLVSLDGLVIKSLTISVSPEKDVTISCSLYGTIDLRSPGAGHDSIKKEKK